MYFDKKEFKDFFSPKENYLNLNWKPKCVFDVIYIGLFCVSFGWLTVPMALGVSIKFK